MRSTQSYPVKDGKTGVINVARNCRVAAVVVPPDYVGTVSLRTTNTAGDDCPVSNDRAAVDFMTSRGHIVLPAAVTESLSRVVFVFDAAIESVDVVFVTV